MTIARRPINRALLGLDSTTLTPPAFVYKPRADKFSPSPQQAAYFDFLKTGTGSAVVIAVAGSGKTTTLVRGLAFQEGSIFLGAYNKSASQEIKDRVAAQRLDRKGLYINTVHGACFSEWRRVYPKVEVDDRKVGNLVKRLSQTLNDLRVMSCMTFLTKMVSFGKQFLAGVKFSMDAYSTWAKLADHFSADQELPEGVTLQEAITWVAQLSIQSREQCPVLIDFDDMIYAPIAYNVRFFQNDWVMLDEVQDINPARREAAHRMLKRGGRFIGVGDDRQAIYGFTGAGSDSIEKIREEFACVTLPLTITYRCPKAVVQHAHQWVSHIEAAETAPDGIVRKFEAVAPSTGPVLEWFRQETLLPTDAILCRYTAPLIKAAYSMIKAGIPCKVEGREIGKGLATLAQKWRISTIDKLVERLETWRANELAKAALKESERAAQDANDKVDTLLVIVERCRLQNKHLIADLVAEIAALFSDDVRGVVTLSTGHKAKGREWDRVYWLQRAAAGYRCKKEWEQVQEDNVSYVICTRAKKELVLVTVQ